MPAAAAPDAPDALADAVGAAAGREEPLGAFSAPSPACSLADPISMAPSVDQMASDGGSSDDDDGAADSDYDSDDNSADAQMHRFFSKVESLGIPLCEDVLADPWA